jgi:predicted RNA-binding Zn-ribbon protein involved in translation (DUF1610 family)
VQYYKIIVKHSDKCLNIIASNPNDGAEAIQFNCAQGGDNQLWRLEEKEPGFYKIIVKHSDKCLNIIASNPNDGAKAIQFNCAQGGDNQLWRFEPEFVP